MHSIGDVILGIANKDTSENGDYYDNDGFLMCGKCNTRKQFEVRWPLDESGVKRVPIPCECKAAAHDAEKEAQRKKRFEDRMNMLKKDGITDPQYLDFRFAEDDRSLPKISDVCLKYVESWAEMKANNIGILFYGEVGTGKSFFACCIANALLEKLVPVSVTNFPRILNRLQGFDDEKQGFIDKLQRYELLVIDDLGVERDTSYVAEQVYNVIDTRERSGKPLIITTNLTVAQMESTTDIQYKRIYDRVLKMCPIQLNMAGPSRRVDEAARRREIAKQIIRGAKNG